MKQELAGSFGRFHTQLRNRSLLYTLGSRRSYDSIYLLTAIGLTPGGSSTIHIYTQTIHRTTQLTTLVGRLTEFAEKEVSKLENIHVAQQFWCIR